MTQIDKAKPILVTGATGYVAGWLVKKLLDEGLVIHAAVRDPNKKEKIEHLQVLTENSSGSIKFFETDLLQEGSYAEAMDGCELVYHTASPFTTAVKDPQKELIDPALSGTRNVLVQACKTSSVRRVVVTSSCAAIYTDCTDLDKTPDGVFTEDVWNTTASLDYQPYSYSKTLAEKEAWKIADQQNQWDLIAVNPCGVFGPALNPKSTSSESINILKQIGDGTLRMGAPNIGLGVVDVRDVAEAHYRAGFRPEANGRNIIAAHNSSLLEMARILHDEFGNEYPIPKRPAPKWLMMVVGPMINKMVTRKFVRNNVNHEWKADNTKSKKELGMTYRPLKETLVDGFRVLIENKMI